MGRYIEAKNRIARRCGANIYGKRRSPLLKRSNKPGQHGQSRSKKSPFGLQLEKFQQLKAVYGMLRTQQIINYYAKAKARPGATPDHFVGLLESRLDMVTYRLGFAPTIFAAQQLVAHKHLLVNGKSVNVRSYLLKEGDVISFRDKSKSLAIVQAALEANREVPAYLTLEKEQVKGTFLYAPKADQASHAIAIDFGAVCDYLSFFA